MIPHDHPARQVFRMWHRGREADEVLTDEVEFPERMPKIGEALEICYWSDKFARRCKQCGKVTEDKMCHGRTERAVGTFELYRHDCDSHAPVYAAMNQPGAREYIEVEPDKSRIAVTQLAFMDSLVVRLNNGKKVVQDFPFETGAGTPLYCLPDKKTLIIPWEHRPIICTGAKMKITAHGIIH